MAVSYAILLFINLKPEYWNAGLVRQVPVFAVEYLLGALNTLISVFLADGLQRLLMKRYGAEALGFGRLWLNLAFLVLFLAIGVSMSVPGVIIVRLLTEQVFDLGNHIFYESPEYVAHGVRAGMALFTIMALVIYFIILNRHIMIRTQAMQDRAEQLEKEQALAQFNSLKNQVNPHFLFNSLSILSSLVQVDADLSERFILQMSKTYRYILEQKDHDLVSLQTELDFIESYAFLLKIRFANKFDLQIQPNGADPGACQIPPLTLQLLVENAVKHNRMSVLQPLLVEIVVEENTLLVKNRLQPRPVPNHSTGIGLQNIINRYALLTDRPVWAGESAEHFLVRVPLLFPEVLLEMPLKP